MKGQSAMTIKDMEARTGMSRANIRYYEQEGLIAPQRDSNGYRNYQESDVQALERILLMRRLGVSLEDIRALQAGSLPLGEAMERQADKLGREQQGAAAAQAHPAMASSSTLSKQPFKVLPAANTLTA